MLVHSRARERELCDFFSEYFEVQDCEDIATTDEREISWQDNELARYLEATRNPKSGDLDSPSSEDRN